MADKQHVRFLFDPGCPWAWRASLWIREVAQVRRLEIEWDLLSLGYVNREHADEAAKQRAEQRKPLMRLLEMARLRGSEAIDRLYLALGTAVHEQKQDLQNEAVWREALANAGLPDEWLRQAHKAVELDPELEQRYEYALSGGAIGVPTIYFNESEAPYFGPVIKEVPQGEDAGRLWDHLAWIATQPYFFELKRGRT